MTRMRKAVAALAMVLGFATTAHAGDYNGNFMVRLQATGVITQDDLNSLTSGATDLKAAGFDAEVSDRILPTATLTYFLTKNLGLELFCCFSKHKIDLKSPVAGIGGNVAESWIFPPALTLTYHFDGMGAFKPYVGAGAQYVHFFSSDRGNNTLSADSVKFDDAFGVTVQAGFDLAIGGGWYLNADIKKSWLDTTVTWRNSTVTGADIVAKADIDPLIVSVGVGYRFNLEDLFGRRQVESLK